MYKTRPTFDPRHSGEDDLAQFMFGNATIEYSSVTPFDTPNIYIPFFYFVEFTCMFGWLKVAETMLNPFGEDDAGTIFCQINVPFLNNIPPVTFNNYFIRYPP